MDIIIEIFKRFENFFHENWHHWYILASIIVLENLLIIYFLKSVNLENFITYSFCIVLSLLTLLIWYKFKKIEKTPKGKIGFVVSIYCSEKNKENCIREDFVINLKKLIKNNNIENKFHFIEIRRHLSQQIDDVESASELMEKTKSLFIIYGRARHRNHEGKNYYFLELDGIVKHRPISKGNSDNLNIEFNELFPKKIQIPEDEDIFSFNITSEWVEFVSTYIIGIAAFCSGNIEYANSLYNSLNKRPINSENSIDVYSKIKQRLPKRFAEINLVKAKNCLENWRQDKSFQNTENFSQYMASISTNIIFNDYELTLLKSIDLFFTDRNTTEAIRVLKKCKKIKDPIWKLNLAFLFAYNGNMKSSLRYYRMCTKEEFEAENLSQVEDFIYWVITNENKYHLYFCLGFFNWEIKGDKAQAMQDFRQFLKLTEPDNFKKEKELAAEWIAEIDNELNDTRNVA